MTPTAGKRELRFVVQTTLVTNEKYPEYLLFQIHSKAQLHSNPKKWYISVGEFLEPEAQESPVFVLGLKEAEDLARNLLAAVDECRQFSDS